MKSQTLLAALILTAGASIARSETKPTPTPTSPVKTGPCQAVMAACQAAGYTQSGHAQGKGIHADCVAKLFRGESVAGVSVTQEQIKACENRHQQIDSGMQQHGKLPVDHKAFFSPKLKPSASPVPDVGMVAPD